MVGYRTGSPWSDANELKCLLIYKMLEEAGFIRGMQSGLAETLARSTHLKTSSINAKICNYKSLAGVNSQSNYSSQSQKIYERFGSLSAAQLRSVLGSYGAH